jgi:hypothetical protein
MDTDVGRYAVRYDRLMVRTDTGAWMWFDGPVLTLLRFQDIAAAVLEVQAQRAVETVGAENCRIVRFRLWGVEAPVDWNACLENLNQRGAEI